MTWARIDVGIFRNPKMLDCSNEAKVVYIAGICYSAEHLTDGLLKRKTVALLLAEASAGWDIAGELTNAGLWTHEGDGFLIHDYLEYQPSAEEVREKQEHLRQVRSEAGKRGAEARWHGKHGKDDSNSHAIANGKTMAKNGYVTVPNVTVPNDGSSVAVTARAREDGGGGESDPRILKALGALRLSSSDYDAIAGIASEFPTDTEANRPLSPEGEAEACWSWYHSGAYSRDPAKVNWVTAYRSWMRRAAHPGGSEVKPVPLRGGGKREKRENLYGPDDYAALERLERKHAERLAAKGERDATAQ